METKIMRTFIFDLIGVITKESYFATKILFPLIEDKISYNEFKKRYILLCVNNISELEFWDGIINKQEQFTFKKNFFSQHVLYNEKIINLIKKLKLQNNNLYLASEIPEKWGELFLKYAGLDEVFDEKFYSSTIGYTKPFFKFFDYVINSININDSVYYIDDTSINLLMMKKYFFDSVNTENKYFSIKFNKDFQTNKGVLNKKIDYYLNSEKDLEVLLTEF